MKELASLWKVQFRKLSFRNVLSSSRDLKSSSCSFTLKGISCICMWSSCPVCVFWALIWASCFYPHDYHSLKYFLPFWSFSVWHQQPCNVESQSLKPSTAVFITENHWVSVSVHLNALLMIVFSITNFAIYLYRHLKSALQRCVNWALIQHECTATFDLAWFNLTAFLCCCANTWLQQQHLFRSSF